MEGNARVMPSERKPRTLRPPRSARTADEDREVIGSDEPHRPRQIVDAFARRGIALRLADDGQSIFAEPAALLTCRDLTRLATYRENLLPFLASSRRRI